MNNIKLTIELCEDDRKLIDGLTGAASLLATVISETLPTEVQMDLRDLTKVGENLVNKARAHLEGLGLPQQTVEVTAVDLSNVDTSGPADPVIVPPAPVEEAPAPEPVTLAEFQKAVTLAVSKSADAKKAVKALINKYAASVSAVPADKRSEVMAELANI